MSDLHNAQIRLCSDIPFGCSISLRDHPNHANHGMMGFSMLPNGAYCPGGGAPETHGGLNVLPVGSYILLMVEIVIRKWRQALSISSPPCSRPIFQRSIAKSWPAFTIERVASMAGLGLCQITESLTNNSRTLR